MSLCFWFSLTFTVCFLSLLTRSTSLPTIGVTFPAATSNTHSKQPSREQVAATVQSLGFRSVRLEASDPAMVRTFLYSNTTLILTIPNQLVPVIAANRSSAVQWLYLNVVPFFPRAKITTISVGNDLLESSPRFSTFLLPAMRNINLALRDLGIRKISVSTSFSFLNVISTSFPPSSSMFRSPVLDILIRPLLQFLHETNSSFLVNIYPYNVYRLQSEIPIGYALFQEHPFNFRDDLTTGVRYRNLFDMMVDAVISAMAVAGHDNIPVIVAETGWPSSSSDASEVEANPAYAEMYIKGLIGHLRSGLGTPLRKEGVSEIYIYELFDKEEKNVNNQYERTWGILYPNMTNKYQIDFSGSAAIFGFGGRESLEMAAGLFLISALLHGSLVFRLL
ncbi:hypothetical protein FNV43_RR24631 [Rhamnella rubrinervis]|uniref:glucan endo-1,3-beta-D-glucosidase n=1 Tax=Rhamnella rubrinervis TaxID=2594499 RepID=A0A8K0DSM6_9ROSA|nr:hypothetical protein FNV43_RR24631 [Rhamnella rubrinervis]